jgi:peptide methionine sulfoxide reductase MsrA
MFLVLSDIHGMTINSGANTVVLQVCILRSKPSKRQYRHILFLNTPNHDHEDTSVLDGTKEQQQQQQQEMLEQQKHAIRTKIRALEQTSPIHVSVEPLVIFYRAEEHHQRFLSQESGTSGRSQSIA